MLLLLSLMALVVSEARPLWHQLEHYSFEQYERDFNKRYISHDERFKRRQIFSKNLASIRAHNAAGGHSWKAGVNHLTDRTQEEFKKLLGTRPHVGNNKAARRPDAAAGSPLPLNKDWRDEGIISAVKDQGMCGSCWSFCSAETIEAYYALKTGQLAVLSEQMILDCTPNPQQCGGTGGCGGATIQLAYDTVIRFGGIPQEFTYPYESYFGTNMQCQNASQRNTPFAKISSYVNLPTNEYQPIMDHLAHYGPLAIVVDASAWQSYESGVFDSCSVNATLDHGVQLVGYGHDPMLGDYWLVRNSWSPTFGENGYIRLKRESSPVCGWDNQPLQGTGCPGGPSRQRVCGQCGILFGAVYPIV